MLKSTAEQKQVMETFASVGLGQATRKDRSPESSSHFVSRTQSDLSSGTRSTKGQIDICPAPRPGAEGNLNQEP